MNYENVAAYILVNVLRDEPGWDADSLDVGEFTVYLREKVREMLTSVKGHAAPDRGFDAEAVLKEIVAEVESVLVKQGGR